ncbi:SprT-like domain-containing protein [uncultured Arcobacter sp.]|uniref:SprT-like domain-containing protein n=1 Tax=uncultured Arcobacter sp. TaxID=165434 RepID=UPI00260D227D|nr:SprT-like domain-containing protein [uncultured Arcobacter sp.]
MKFKYESTFNTQIEKFLKEIIFPKCKEVITKDFDESILDDVIIDNIVSCSLFGRYSLSKNTVFLNYKILEADFENFIGVIVHEYVHFLQGRVFKTKIGHNPLFRKVMVSLGYEQHKSAKYKETPNLWYSILASQRKGNKRHFIYTCDCEGREWNVKESNHIWNQKHDTMTCRLCNAKINYTGKMVDFSE